MWGGVRNGDDFQNVCDRWWSLLAAIRNVEGLAVVANNALTVQREQSSLQILHDLELV